MPASTFAATANVTDPPPDASTDRGANVAVKPAGSPGLLKSAWNEPFVSAAWNVSGEVLPPGEPGTRFCANATDSACCWHAGPPVPGVQALQFGAPCQFASQAHEPSSCGVPWPLQVPLLEYWHC